MTIEHWKKKNTAAGSNRKRDMMSGTHGTSSERRSTGHKKSRDRRTWNVIQGTRGKDEANKSQGEEDLTKESRTKRTNL